MQRYIDFWRPIWRTSGTLGTRKGSGAKTSITWRHWSQRWSLSRICKSPTLNFKKTSLYRCKIKIGRTLNGLQRRKTRRLPATPICTQTPTSCSTPAQHEVIVHLQSQLKVEQRLSIRKRRRSRIFWLKKTRRWKQFSTGLWIKALNSRIRVLTRCQSETYVQCLLQTSNWWMISRR